MTREIEPSRILLSVSAECEQPPERRVKQRCLLSPDRCVSQSRLPTRMTQSSTLARMSRPGVQAKLIGSAMSHFVCAHTQRSRCPMGVPISIRPPHLIGGGSCRRHDLLHIWFTDSERSRHVEHDGYRRARVFRDARLL